MIEKVSIECSYQRKGFRTIDILSGTPIVKNSKLTFRIIANNLKDYDIRWQITNTDKEAERAKCLRGDFYDSEIVAGKKVRKENTSYIGVHYVEAYLVKDNICYGKSEPFEVNIIR